MSKRARIMLVAVGTLIGIVSMGVCTVIGMRVYDKVRYEKYWPADPMTYADYKQLKSQEEETGVTWRLMEPFAKRESKLKDSSKVFAMMCVPG